MAIWQEQFATQCKIKKAVILHGNVQDAFWDRGLNGISIGVNPGFHDAILRTSFSVTSKLSQFLNAFSRRMRIE